MCKVGVLKLIEQMFQTAFKIWIISPSAELIP